MKSIIALCLFVLMMPTAFAFAATTQGATLAARETLENPFSGADSLGELFTKLAQFAIDVAYVVVAAFLLVSGFKFVKAQGNPEGLAEAKRTFWYTIIGAALVVGMQTIIAVFKSVIEQLGSR